MTSKKGRQHEGGRELALDDLDRVSGGVSTTNSRVHTLLSGASTSETGPPDVCETPDSGREPAIPVPYPDADADPGGDNSMKSGAAGEKSVSKPAADTPPSGDEAGAVGGVSSAAPMHQVKWANAHFDVKVEGGDAVRLADVMQRNKA